MRDGNSPMARWPVVVVFLFALGSQCVLKSAPLLFFCVRSFLVAYHWLGGQIVHRWRRRQPTSHQQNNDGRSVYTMKVSIGLR